ncbi:MAG: DUF1236 domain-containing protein [Pseudolabrys sp.]
MTTRYLVITAALLAGTSLALAQAPASKQEGAAPAPPAQQSAPAEKVAPAPANGTPAEKAPAAERKAQSAKPDLKKTGAKSDAKSDKTDAKTDIAPQGPAKSSAEIKGKSGEPAAAQAKPDAKPDAQSTTTTGQGAAGARGAVNLSPEQRTKIHTVIKEKVHAAPVTNVNFSISIGTRVPRTVHYYPLPTEVVEIYPSWRGYDFILVGDQIVVIDPRTLEIVAVIEA